MSIYQSQLESVVSQIETTVSDLNNYVDSANASTTRTDYDKYVALYDTSKMSYDELLAKYDIAVDNLERYNTYNLVSTEEIDIPNAKDPMEWMAGGILRNETFPGGSGFSGTSVPAFANKAKPNDLSANLLAGSFSFLNPAWAGIVALNNLGYFNLLYDDDKRDTKVFKINVAIIGYNEDGTSYIAGEGEGEIYGSISGGDTKTSTFTDTKANLTSVDKVINNHWNMLTSIETIASGNKIGLAISLVDMLTGDKYNNMSTSEFLSAGVYGAVRGLFSSVIGNMIGLGMLGSIIVGAIFDELVEISVGLDNSFGIGGQLTQSPTGTSMYGESEGFLGISTGLKGLENMFANSGIGGLFYDEGDILNTMSYTNYDQTKELAREFNYVGFSKTDYFSSVGAYSVESSRYSYSYGATYDTFANGWSVYTDKTTMETIAVTPDNDYIQSDRFGNVIASTVENVNVTKATDMATSLKTQMEVVEVNTVERSFFGMLYDAITSDEAIDNAGTMYANNVNSFLGNIGVYEWNSTTNKLQFTEFFDPTTRALKSSLATQGIGYIGDLSLENFQNDLNTVMDTYDSAGDGATGSFGDFGSLSSESETESGDFGFA